MKRAIDLTRLTRTARWLETHPDRYEPTLWGLRHPVIGTIADFAGWTVMLHDPRLEPPLGIPDGVGGWTVAEHWTIDGEWMPALAQRLLGLDTDQRAVLFHVGLTLEAMSAVVRALADSQGTLTGRRLAGVATRAGAAGIAV